MVTNMIRPTKVEQVVFNKISVSVSVLILYTSCFINVSVETYTLLRLVQTCVNGMRLRSKIENFLTGCIFCMREKQPRLVRLTQYV